MIWEGSRVCGVELEDGTACKADHVIVATTPDAAARILPDEMDEQRGFLASFPRTPIPLPVFFLDRPLNAEVCFYFGDPSEDRNFNMAVDQTARVPEMVPSGKAIVSAWAAYPKTEELIAQPDDELIGAALEDMEGSSPGSPGGWTTWRWFATDGGTPSIRPGSIRGSSTSATRPRRWRESRSSARPTEASTWRRRSCPRSAPWAGWKGGGG